MISFAPGATFLSLISPMVATLIGVTHGEAFGTWHTLGALLVLGSVVHAQITGAAGTPNPACEVGDETAGDAGGEERFASSACRTR